jgi:hypothetical protein
MLGGQSALGRHDQAVAGESQLPQRRVVANAADHEAAAVQEQHRMQPPRTRPIHAHRQRARGTWDLDVLDRVQLARRPLKLEHSEVVFADGVRRQLAHQRRRTRRPSTKQLANFKIKLGHRTALYGAVNATALAAARPPSERVGEVHAHLREERARSAEGSPPVTPAPPGMRSSRRTAYETPAADELRSFRLAARRLPRRSFALRERSSQRRQPGRSDRLPVVRWEEVP